VCNTFFHCWPGKVSALQNLVKQAKPLAVPPKDLNPTQQRNGSAHVLAGTLQALSLEPYLELCCHCHSGGWIEVLSGLERGVRTAASRSPEQVAHRLVGGVRFEKASIPRRKVTSPDRLRHGGQSQSDR
jgi:hypothetical protein